MIIVRASRNSLWAITRSTRAGKARVAPLILDKVFTGSGDIMDYFVVDTLYIPTVGIPDRCGAAGAHSTNSSSRIGRQVIHLEFLAARQVLTYVVKSDAQRSEDYFACVTG